MRIAIVGMGGDIGTGVALRFHSDPAVSMLGLDMEPPRRRIKRTEFHRVPPTEVDARTELLRDFDPEVLIHLGIYEPHSRSNPVAAEIRTRAATRSVFQAALESPSLEHVVMRSGIDVYGSRRRDHSVPAETAPLSPTSRFGRMLVDAEATARSFGLQRPEVPVTVLRFAPIVGPYIPSPLGRYLRLPVVPVGLPFERPIQLVHIDDVHDAFAAAVRARIPGAFNVVGEGTITGSKAARIGNRLVAPVWGPGWRVARTITGMLGSPLPEHSAEALQRGQVADGSKAKKELDFTPARSTRACVEDLYDWASVVRLDVDREAA